LIEKLVKGDLRMPKKTKAKTKTKTKTKTTNAKKVNVESEREKKTKMETAKLRLSKPLKIAENFSGGTRAQPTRQVHAAEITKKTEQSKTDVLPINIYWLEVDGRPKSEYPTEAAASKAGLELKRKYPHIRVAVFNSKDRSRTTVELS
jgi:outer membrane biosynthesis protein TonB